MEEPISTLLTTVSLNFLNIIGIQNSVVFSSVFLFSSLTNYSLDNNAPLPFEIIKGIPAFDPKQVNEELKEMTSNLRDKNLSTTIWKYPFSVKQLKHFHSNASYSVPMRFMSMDKKKNFEVSCDEEDNQWAMDDCFNVLSIPMCPDSLSFVIFMPKDHSQPLLKKLDTKRFQNLIHDLSPGFIHFKIPMFKISSTIPVSRKLTLKKNIVSNYKFKTSDHSENCGRYRKRSPRGIIKQPCETIPIFYHFNRPFVFAVLNKTVPLVMGIFNGDM